MSSHIQEAIIGGLITGAFSGLVMIAIFFIAFGSLKRMFRKYPPHRHVNGLVLYPKGFESGEVQPLVRANGPANDVSRKERSNHFFRLGAPSYDSSAY